MVVGELATDVDVAVLGAGPAGYSAAIRAAQLGRQVVVVDPWRPGGRRQLTWEIGLQALVRAAALLDDAAHLGRLGLVSGDLRPDWSGLQRWKAQLLAQLSAGVAGLLSHYDIDYAAGRGVLLGDNELRVEGTHGAERYRYQQLIVAVGSEPLGLPGLVPNDRRLLTPAAVLALPAQPDRLAVVGGGKVAAALVSLLARLGTDVRWLVPAGQDLLPGWEPAAAAQLRRGAAALAVTLEEAVADVADAVAGEPLVAVAGRRRVPDFGAPAVGLPDGQPLAVDAHMATGTPGVFAAGDVVAGGASTAVALAQGRVAAEAACGHAAAFEPQALPDVVWATPELARVGLSPAEATRAGYRARSARFPLTASAGALLRDEAGGFTQLVADEASGLVLGATLVGPGAAERIGMVGLALEMGATVTDLAATLAAHPTLQESLGEAALQILNAPLHGLGRLAR